MLGLTKEIINRYLKIKCAYHRYLVPGSKVRKTNFYLHYLNNFFFQFKPNIFLKLKVNQ